MPGTRSDLPPTLAIQHAIDGAFGYGATDPDFEGRLHLCGTEKSARLGFGQERTKELGLLLRAQVLVPTPSYAIKMSPRLVREYHALIRELATQNNILEGILNEKPLK